jgi:putative DNA primase/helicase
MNSTITERGGELQRYVELIGAGDTGKGCAIKKSRKI